MRLKLITKPTRSQITLGCRSIRLLKKVGTGPKSGPTNKRSSKTTKRIGPRRPDFTEAVAIDFLL
jgi:hypothetical protein